MLRKGLIGKNLYVKTAKSRTKVGRIIRCQEDERTFTFWVEEKQVAYFYSKETHGMEITDVAVVMWKRGDGPKVEKVTIYEEIRSLIRQGYSNKEITDKLYVTDSQIQTQRKRIREEALR